MAEKSESKAKSQEAKTESVPNKIQVVGTKDPLNGAAILHFKRDNNRKAIDLIPGQTLTVGEDGDLKPDEAKRLLSYQGWTIKEVNE